MDKKTSPETPKKPLFFSVLQIAANLSFFFSALALAFYIAGNFSGFLDKTLILSLKILSRSAAFLAATSIFSTISAPFSLRKTKRRTKIIFVAKNAFFAVFGAAAAVASSFVIFLAEGA